MAFKVLKQKLQLNYVLALACDLQTNLFVANHAGLNSSWATELACFSVVFSFVGWICSTNRASSMGFCIPHHTGQVLLPWRRGATRRASCVKLSLLSAWIFLFPRISSRWMFTSTGSKMKSRAHSQLVSHFSCFHRITHEQDREGWFKDQIQQLISTLSSHVVTGQNIVFVHIVNTYNILFVTFCFYWKGEGIVAHVNVLL